MTRRLRWRTVKITEDATGRVRYALAVDDYVDSQRYLTKFWADSAMNRMNAYEDKEAMAFTVEET